MFRAICVLYHSTQPLTASPGAALTIRAKSGHFRHLPVLCSRTFPISRGLIRYFAGQSLIADAILDCTAPGDIVLDPFLGSGTTILACERTRRRGYGLEIDPLYVDTIINRWQRLTGKQAMLSTGETFDEAKLRCQKSSEKPGSVSGAH